MINGLGGGIAPLPSFEGRNATVASGTGGGFGSALSAALQNVDSLQTGADTQISNLVQGAPGADISKTMVSVEKADVAFQLMLQVRNKAVSAYQDIEKMQF